MGRKAKDISNIKFGRITPIRIVGSKNDTVVWECKCDCGTIFNTTGASIRAGTSKSCGCFRKEHLSLRQTTHGYTKKGVKKPVEYYAWHSMKDRCSREKHPDYHRYGGRGIKVCGRWLTSFENFLSDMGRRPTKNHSLDRKNNNEGYSPENCRWATMTEQNSNRRDNVWIEYKGHLKTAAEWSRILGITTGNIGVMMKRKKSIYKIFEYYEKTRGRIFSY